MENRREMTEVCRRAKDGLKQAHLVNAKELEAEIKRTDMMLCNCIEIACMYGRMAHPKKKELAKVYEDNARQLREKRDGLMEELGRMNGLKGGEND